MRKVKVSMTLLQFMGFVIFIMTLVMSLVFIRMTQIKDELLEAQKQQIRSEGLLLNYHYVYTPTEGCEMVDGFMPGDVSDLDDFQKAACMIAQTMYGECRGLSKYEQSMVAWTILNRVDSRRFGETIEDVITAPGQFFGYSSSHPIDKPLYDLAVDVLMRWSYEGYIQGESGRTLPKEYLYFYGKDGHNWFKDQSGIIFDCSSIDPYGDKSIGL